MVHSLLEATAVEPGHRSTKPPSPRLRRSGLTYADYLALPDDGLRHEIIDGVHWLIDPDENGAIVYRRGTIGFQHAVRLSRTDVLTTPMLPGLEMPLDRLFA